MAVLQINLSTFFITIVGINHLIKLLFNWTVFFLYFIHHSWFAGRRFLSSSRALAFSFLQEVSRLHVRLRIESPSFRIVIGTSERHRSSHSYEKRGGMAEFRTLDPWCRKRWWRPLYHDAPLQHLSHYFKQTRFKDCLPTHGLGWTTLCTWGMGIHKAFWREDIF